MEGSDNMDRPLAWGSAGLDDDSFVDSFERCEYPNERFRHADHIRLAWIYIRRFGVGAAEERITAAIRRFAASLGHEEKFHATITCAWVRLVYVAYCATPDTEDFGRFLTSHLWLCEKSSMYAFYSQERLASAQARQGWVEPDLRTLPLAPQAKVS